MAEPCSVTSLAALILAGGASSRLGRPKQMLPFHGHTLLEHAIAQVEAVPELEHILAVLPPDASLIPDPAASRATIVRRPEDDDAHCSNSLRAGLNALSTLSADVLILPADQPGLDAVLIARAARSWLRHDRRSSQPPALTLTYRGRPGHPFVFSHRLRDRLLALHGDKAMWKLLEELGEVVERVEVDVPPPLDVDTWDDYRRLVPPRAEMGV